MVRRCWVNFQCRGVLLIWIIVGRGPIALAVGAGGGCLDIFSLICHFSFLSPSLWERARYRLKYCLKGPLSPKQPTNQLIILIIMTEILLKRSQNCQVIQQPSGNGIVHLNNTSYVTQCFPLKFHFIGHNVFLRL